MKSISDYWKCSPDDLFEQYQRISGENLQPYCNLQSYCEENSDNLLELWNNGKPEDDDDLRDVLKYASSVLMYFGASLTDHPELSILFEMGRLSGMVDAIGQMRYAKLLEQEADWSYEHEVKQIRHLDEIMRLLYQKGSMNQSEMCESLHVSESSMSQIIKKAEPMNLLQFMKVGKYKYYRLTDYGGSVAERMFETGQQTLSMDQMLLIIAEEMSLNIGSNLALFKEYIRQFRDHMKSTGEVPDENGRLSDPQQTQYGSSTLSQAAFGDQSSEIRQNGKVIRLKPWYESNGIMQGRNAGNRFTAKESSYSRILIKMQSIRTNRLEEVV